MCYQVKVSLFLVQTQNPMLTSSDVLICQGLPIPLGWGSYGSPQQQAQLLQESFPEDAPLLLQPEASKCNAIISGTTKDWR